MIVGMIKLNIHVPWVHSLKEKRKEVRSICDKVSSRYNASIAEVDKQDIHQEIVLGIAWVTNRSAHGHSIADNILNFIEDNTEGDIIDIQRDIVSVGEEY